MKKHALEHLGYKLDGAPDTKQTLELRRQTDTWWKQVLMNPKKLFNWLKKLRNTEEAAYQRFVDFANEYCKNNPHYYRVFTTIAEQEAEHAKIIEALLTKYGEKIDLNKKYPEKYWSEAQKCVNDMETAAGLGFFAEDLSLQRMLVIIDNPETPSDLKELFERLHADEKFHVNALKRIAGEKGVNGVIDCHSKGLEALGLAINGITTNRVKVGRLINMG